MTNWTDKLDSVWKGFLIGLVFPLIFFFLYWLFFHHQLNFPRGFYRYLVNGHILSGVIKVCGLGDLLIFYFGLTKKLDKFSRGVIFSLIIYVALVAYVSYYLEPDII